ncbi:hypothetical protein [Pseudolabrys sp. FHR47]|uniref:hypothetical protein n=1 Tax=Pseudolabrys sp. FHR47 TaxID=2562284 RepID=UPI0010BF385A|nr:hypothetical protein [Pseudolabrys sp. FHR47]
MMQRMDNRPREAQVVLPYEPNFTGHWEAARRRQETREWLRRREQAISAGEPKRDDDQPHKAA